MDGFGVTLAFWVLAGVTLVAAGGVMVSRNLLHAVLFLILTFVGIAGFFVLLSADFIAMAPRVSGRESRVTVIGHRWPATSWALGRSAVRPLWQLHDDFGVRRAR